MSLPAGGAVGGGERELRYTVAIALAGESAAPGGRKGGAVKRNRDGPLARS